MNMQKKISKEEIEKVSGGDDTITANETFESDRHYICPICRWRFRSSIDLQAHMKSAHNNQGSD